MFHTEPLFWLTLLVVAGFVIFYALIVAAEPAMVYVLTGEVDDGRPAGPIPGLSWYGGFTACFFAIFIPFGQFTLPGQGGSRPVVVLAHAAIGALYLVAIVSFRRACCRAVAARARRRADHGDN